MENHEALKLNPEAAIQRLGNSKSLYIRILTKFQSSHEKAGEEFIALFSSGDMEGAQRLAHTIKGVAGNIGADALFHASEALEGFCRKNDFGDEFEASKALFCHEVDEAVSAVKAYISTVS